MIERKYMAHYIDAGFNSALSGTGVTLNWVRLGEDLEELNVELNPDVEQKKNILGENTARHRGYEESQEVDPYYADEDDPLFVKLQAIVDQRKTGDDCATFLLEVHLWEAGAATGSYVAYAQPCLVVPTSYGGDTSGYQIPFTVYPKGERVPGTFVLATKTFTATAAG